MSATVLRHVRLARPRLAARGLLAFLAELDDRYRARVRLAQLDDRMLRDIGVTRADDRRRAAPAARLISRAGSAPAPRRPPPPAPSRER